MKREKQLIFDFETDESLRYLVKFGKKNSSVRFKTELEAIGLASSLDIPAYVYSIPLYIIVFENIHTSKYRKN